MIGNIRRVRLEEIAGPVRRTLGRRLRLRRQSDRLRGANRAMYAALEQVREGIPLNWTQVEDDPALQTLAYLSSRQGMAAWRGSPVPEDLRESIYQDLAAKLPAPKAKPVKEAPKPLAGFSESVPVLTQAEDDLPGLSATALGRLRVALVIAVVAGLALLAFGKLAETGNLGPAFSWIDLRVSGKQVSRTTHPRGWTAPTCKRYDINDPNFQRNFNMAVTYPDQAQQSVGFPISFLPETLTISSTYTFKLLEVGISPCTEDAPDPTDPGTMVKVAYSARQSTGSATSSEASLTLFQGLAVPLPVNLTTGGWKTLDIDGANAVYWHGSTYTDIEGTQWIGDISVMAVESGNSVRLFVGPRQSGITEQMLTALVAQTR